MLVLGSRTNATQSSMPRASQIMALQVAASKRETAGTRLARRALALGLGLALFAPAWAATAASGRPARKMKTVLEFDSRLKDENNKPVSGIFHMTFTLLKGKRTKWKESHWVAVDNGAYALQLGKEKDLPKDFEPADLTMQVAIDGAGVVLRESLAGGDSNLTQVDVGSGGGKRIVQYAEKAGFAYDSEHAVAADRVGPYTGKLLAETLDKLERRKTKVKVSRNRLNLTSAGGVGGIPFEQVCPPGTVAVGLRGGSGIYIDNVQIICAPLE